MIRKAFLAALALAAMVSALDAQTPRERRTPRAEPRAFSFSFSGNRARIGVLVNTVVNSDTDRLGAKIDGVTPGGPADQAGLKAGDIITRFNGTSLAGASSEDAEESGPGHKLIELVGALDPGDTVRVEYRRGSETKTASIVTDEQGYSGNLVGPEIAQMEMPRQPLAALMGEGNGFCFGDAWCDLDLVTLGPELGEYFGTREGILVVKAPGDSSLPLKAGDVILAIGGRKPTSPAHAMRILRSYDSGETVSIDIMRHERRQTLSYAVPQAGTHWKLRSPRGPGESSFWMVEPEALGAATRAVRQQLEQAQRSMRDAVRLRLDSRLHQEEIRALRGALRRSSTAL